MSTALRLSRVHFPVTALGPGRRLGIWVQGCTLACPGCMSRDTWDPAGGTEQTFEAVIRAWRVARADGAVGVTVSGGEPSQQAGPVSAVLRAIRAEDPDADSLLYTGLDTDELRAQAPQLLAAVDAVVVGRFEVTQPTDLVWRGSANQALLPVTALGRARFGPYLDAVADSPQLQVIVDERIWTIGIPRVGDLPRLERLLRQRGIVAAGVSWRP